MIDHHSIRTVRSFSLASWTIPLTSFLLSQVCGDEPRQLPFPIIQPIDMDDVAAVAPEYEGSLISTVLDEISTPDARLR